MKSNHETQTTDGHKITATDTEMVYESWSTRFAFAVLSRCLYVWRFEPIPLPHLRSDAAGRDGFLDDLVGQVVRQRVVVRELHVIRAAGLGDASSASTGSRAFRTAAPWL